MLLLSQKLVSNPIPCSRVTQFSPHCAEHEDDKDLAHEEGEGFAVEAGKFGELDYIHPALA